MSTHFRCRRNRKTPSTIVRLTAGSYTVICATANNDDPGGEVLVEVYFLP
jgi:hypothetical protein